MPPSVRKRELDAFQGQIHRRRPDASTREALQIEAARQIAWADPDVACSEEGIVGGDTPDSLIARAERRDLKLLKGLTQGALDRASKEVGERGKRGSRPEYELVEGALAIWRKYSDKKPVAYKNALEERGGGAFFNFVESLLSPFGYRRHDSLRLAAVVERAIKQAAKQS
jgi:hypothetical protein